MTRIRNIPIKNDGLRKKAQAVIVFLKLDFDLPHIIYRNLVVNFLKSRPKNDVFLKLNQNFSYLIHDTNESEG